MRIKVSYNENRSICKTLSRQSLLTHDRKRSLAYNEDNRAFPSLYIKLHEQESWDNSNMPWAWKYLTSSLLFYCSRGNSSNAKTKKFQLHYSTGSDFCAFLLFFQIKKWLTEPVSHLLSRFILVSATAWPLCPRLLSDWPWADHSSTPLF